LRFCLQDEEHDPSEEFEEYMACAVCGDNCKHAFILMFEDEDGDWGGICRMFLDDMLRSTLSIRS